MAKKTKTELLERAEELGLDVSEDNTNDEIAEAIAEAEGDEPAATADGIDRSGPQLFDLFGADGRRIVRRYARGAAQEIAARIENTTGEKTKLKPSDEG